MTNDKPLLCSVSLADLTAALEFLPRRLHKSREHLDGVLIEYGPGNKGTLVALESTVIGAMRVNVACAAQGRGAVMLPSSLIRAARRAAGASRKATLVDILAPASIRGTFGELCGDEMEVPTVLSHWRDLFPREYGRRGPEEPVNPTLLVRVSAAAGEAVYVRHNERGAFVHTKDMRVVAVVAGLRDMEELPDIPEWLTTTPESVA